MQHKHTRFCPLAYAWPDPPMQIVLVEPEIPPNTGNIARLCAATATRLHLVGKLGFRLTDSALRRAGLDYWDAVDITRHPDLPAFFAQIPAQNCYFFSTKGAKPYTAAKYQHGNALVFGNESRGLDDKLLQEQSDRVLGIPIQSKHVRSLNLATAAGIALYEALRQLQPA